MSLKYIDTTDLPSDPNGSLANLRRELRKAFNHNRDNPDKLDLLKETLGYVLGQMVEDAPTPVPVLPGTLTKATVTTPKAKTKPKLKRASSTK